MKIKTIKDIYFFQLNTCPRVDSFCFKKDQEWIKTPIDQLVNKATKLASFLISVGLKKGDKIGVISTSRTEWFIVDLAISQLGLISVPVFANLKHKQYEYIYNTTAIKCLFISDLERYKKIEPALSNIKSLEYTYSFDPIPGLLSIDEIILKNDFMDLEEVQQISTHIKPSDIATIIFTSGTTGDPKGVVLTHKNIVTNVLDATSLFSIKTKGTESALSLLPIYHNFEKMVCYSYILKGVAIYFNDSIENILSNIQEIKPSTFIAPPKLLEKIYERITILGKELKGIKKILFNWSLKLAKKYNEKGENSWFYNLKLALARRIIFVKWKEKLGGQIQFIGTGSSACQLVILKVFHAVGIPILEGYGITECSPVVSINKLDDYHLGTVGHVLPTIKLKLTKENEILLKGPTVTLGYYNQPELTKKTFTKNGWYITGDIGELIEGNYLKIVDRKAEIFSLSFGNKVSPQIIENVVKTSPYIENVFAVGDGQDHVSAIIQPNWQALNNLNETDYLSVEYRQEYIKNQDVQNLIKQEIISLNKSLKNHEKVKNFRLITDTWKIETDELTPTLKLKRKNLYNKYQYLIKEMFANEKYNSI